MDDHCLCIIVPLCGGHIHIHVRTSSETFIISALLVILFLLLMPWGWLPPPLLLLLPQTTGEHGGLLLLLLLLCSSLQPEKYNRTKTQFRTKIVIFFLPNRQSQCSLQNMRLLFLLFPHPFPLLPPPQKEAPSSRRPDRMRLAKLTPSEI